LAELEQNEKKEVALLIAKRKRVKENKAEAESDQKIIDEAFE
jgi:hypothetical protein